MLLPVDPGKGVLPESFWYVYAADLISLGVQVQPAVFHILGLKPDQFAYPDAGGCHEPDQVVVEMIAVSDETSFQILIVCLADDIFHISFLLHPKHGHRGYSHIPVFHIAV
jgi:hypothetical protein